MEKVLRRLFDFKQKKENKENKYKLNIYSVF